MPEPIPPPRRGAASRRAPLSRGTCPAGGSRDDQVSRVALVHLEYGDRVPGKARPHAVGAPPRFERELDDRRSTTAPRRLLRPRSQRSARRAGPRRPTTTASRGSSGHAASWFAARRRDRPDDIHVPFSRTRSPPPGSRGSAAGAGDTAEAQPPRANRGAAPGAGPPTARTWTTTRSFRRACNRLVDDVGRRLELVDPGGRHDGETATARPEILLRDGHVDLPSESGAGAPRRAPASPGRCGGSSTR
jgi:hypothetical protein